MTRTGRWVKIDENKNQTFNDDFLKNPLSTVQLLTKILRYHGLIYNRLLNIEERLEELCK